MSRQTLLFVTLVLLVAGTAPAAAEVLCTNPSGLVFVRTQCRGGETQVDPVALGLVGPPGPPGPQGLIGPQGPQGPEGPPPPDISARVFNSTNITMPTGATPTSLTFDSVRWDTDAIFSPPGSRLVARMPGKYLICASITWTNNQSGGRQMWILLNGSTVLVNDTRLASPFDGVSQHACSHWELGTGHFVEVQVRHNVGIPLEVLSFGGVAGQDSPEFWMVKLP